MRRRSGLSVFRSMLSHVAFGIAYLLGNLITRTRRKR